MSPVLDDSAWPIVRVALGPLTTENFDAFGDWYLRCIARAVDEGVYIYSVADARGPPPTLALMTHMTRWQRQLTSAHLERCWLSVVVIDNALVRRTLTALNWFRQQTTPQVVVESEGKGFDAIAADLARRGLPPLPRPSWAGLAGG